jgi:hypothetical protein
MKLLNFWLGKLNRLQLLGHGREVVIVRYNGKDLQVLDVKSVDGVVVLTVGD